MNIETLTFYTKQKNGMYDIMQLIYMKYNQIVLNKICMDLYQTKKKKNKNVLCR
uniref:Uncharacterized protein n=1 Tax=Anguilla anguilla TaxID=7936 RepID=A0A0E9SSR9_ANGAN